VIIGVLNQKGGVGKTTLSINIASALHRMGKKPLLVDADPQGSALDWQASRGADSLFPVIGVSKPTLHKDIPNLSSGFDHVVIDGPPRVNDVTRSAILACDLVLVPVQPSPYDVWAADEIVNLIQEVSLMKESLKSLFVVNRKVSKTAIGRDVIEALKGYPLAIAQTAITQRVIFAESAASGQSIFEVLPNGPSAKELLSLVQELLDSSPH
jgi:chromosome partitioning protein